MKQEYNHDLPTGRVSKPQARLPGHSKASQKAAFKAQLIRKRRRRRRLNIILFIGILSAITLFFWAEQRRRSALSQLEETEAQLEKIQGSAQITDEVAAQVLDEVSQLMVLPEDPVPTVATIVDVAKLRATSDFYNQAKDGDHLIVTEDRAILYDPDQKLIIDVVPVKLTNDSSPSPPAPPPAEPPPLEEPPPAEPAPETPPNPPDIINLNP